MPGKERKTVKTSKLAPCFRLPLMLLIVGKGMADITSNSASLVQQPLRAEDGLLSLLIAVPLTRKNPQDSHDTDMEALDPGLFHLAAAQLAVEHFNGRNNSVISTLNGNATDSTSKKSSTTIATMMRGCNITFGRVRAVDTGRVGSHDAVESIFNTLLAVDQYPDAIVGPYYDIPVQELSVVATGLHIPMVSYGSNQHVLFDNANNVDDEPLEPPRSFLAHIGVDAISEIRFVARYLQHKERTQYVAILYDANVATSLPKVNLLRTFLREQQPREQMESTEVDTTYHIKAFPYTLANPQSNAVDFETNIRTVLSTVKETGFQTLVLLPGDGILKLSDAEKIGTAAKEAALDSGQHVWVISSSSVLSRIEVTPNRSNGLKFLSGAAFLVPRDNGYYSQRSTSAALDFRTLLLQQDSLFLENVRTSLLDPILPHEFNNEEMDRVSNETTPLEALAAHWRSLLPGVSFVYDAVMSIGLGACKASEQRKGTTMTGSEHLDGMLALDFVGASGIIKFWGDTEEGDQPGNRLGQTAPFTVLNFVPWSDTNSSFDIIQTESWDPVLDDWVQVGPFTYADGTNVAPRLRAMPEQNYISKGSLTVTISLFAVALLTVVASTVWVVVNREHAVVVASQPIFLYTLCFASLMVTVTILLIGVDETWGLDQKGLDMSCYSYIWLDSLATTLIYSALFTKLWRTNRIFRYKTSKIPLWRVLWPGSLLLLAVLTLLLAFTAHGEFGWTRQVIDESTGESVGFCDSETLYRFIVPIHTIHMIPVCLSGLMAWKTKGFDASYSDSKWVFALILAQSQVMLVGVPSLIILGVTNPGARYIGMALFSFTLPMSTMGLIVLPKIFEVSRIRRQASNHEQSPDLFSTVVDTTQVPDSNRDLPSIVAGDNVEVDSPLSSSSRSKRAPRIQVVTID